MVRYRAGRHRRAVRSRGRADRRRRTRSPIGHVHRGRRRAPFVGRRAGERSARVRARRRAGRTRASCRRCWRGTKNVATTSATVLRVFGASRSARIADACVAHRSGRGRRRSAGGARCVDRIAVDADRDGPACRSRARIRLRRDRAHRRRGRVGGARPGDVRRGRGLGRASGDITPATDPRPGHAPLSSSAASPRRPRRAW